MFWQIYGYLQHWGHFFYFQIFQLVEIMLFLSDIFRYSKSPASQEFQKTYPRLWEKQWEKLMSLGKTQCLKTSALLAISNVFWLKSIKDNYELKIMDVTLYYRIRMERKSTQFVRVTRSCIPLPIAQKRYRLLNSLHLNKGDLNQEHMSLGFIACARNKKM